MTLQQLRDAVTAMNGLSGDLELVILDDGRLRNASVSFTGTGRDEKDKWCDYGTPVILVQYGI